MWSSICALTMFRQCRAFAWPMDPNSWVGLEPCQTYPPCAIICGTAAHPSPRRLHGNSLHMLRWLLILDYVTSPVDINWVYVTGEAVLIDGSAERATMLQVRPRKSAHGGRERQPSTGPFRACRWTCAATSER
jgi:hypothetical protein